MRNFALIAGMLALGASVHATIFDLEPNNSIGTASPITRIGSNPFADIGVGHLTSNDVDFYSVVLFPNEVLTAATTPLSSFQSSPDTEMGVFDGAGNLLAFNDDSGEGQGSVVRFLSSNQATYYIGVTGTGDDGFTGNHSQTGAYQILAGVTPVPEPATFGIFAVGLVGLVIRRKKGQK